MEKTDAAVAAFLTQLQAITTQYGSDAVMGVLAAVHFNGVFNIIIGFILLAIFIFTFSAFIAFMRRAQADKTDSGSIFAGCLISGIASAILLLFTLGFLISSRDWMAIFDPKMALAAKILNL